MESLFVYWHTSLHHKFLSESWRGMCQYRGFLLESCVFYFRYMKLLGWEGPIVPTRSQRGVCTQKGWVPWWYLGKRGPVTCDICPDPCPSWSPAECSPICALGLLPPPLFVNFSVALLREILLGGWLEKDSPYQDCKRTLQGLIEQENPGTAGQNRPVMPGGRDRAFQMIFWLKL